MAEGDDVVVGLSNDEIFAEAWARHEAELQAATLTVWFCTLCRSDVQIGARPAECYDCGDGDGHNLNPVEVRYVPPAVGVPVPGVDGLG